MGQVQAVGGDNGSPGGTTLVVTIAASLAGSLLFIGVMNTGAVEPTSVTDDQSQTWTRCVAPFSSSQFAFCYYKENTAAGVTTVTVNFAVSDAGTAIVVERDDCLRSGALDQTGQGLQNVVTVWNAGNDAPLPATTQNGEIAFVFVATTNSSNQSIAADSPWVAIVGTNITSGHHGNVADGDDCFMASRELTSIGTYTATGTCLSSNIRSEVVTFKKLEYVKANAQVPPFRSMRNPGSIRGSMLSFFRPSKFESPVVAAGFDQALMAAMQDNRQPFVSLPQVVAAGMTPPDQMPN